MHNLKAGPNLMGVAWEDVMTLDGKIDLKEMMDTTRLTSYDLLGSDGEGDSILTWDVGSGWGDVYFYLDAEEVFEDAAYADTWADDGLSPVSVRLEPGQAFWLILKNDISDFPFKGQVAENGTIHTLAEGPNLIANPLPRAIDFTDKTVVTTSGATPYDLLGSDGEGDSILTWNIGSGWGDVYFYIDAEAVFEDAAYADTWADDGLNPANAVIPVGSGLWYIAKNAGVKVTFKGL